MALVEGLFRQAEYARAFYNPSRECTDYCVVEDLAASKTRIKIQQLSDNRACFLHATSQG
jgi:hypothetical protein